ncbi:MAG: flagellar basal body P-ring protein FlgI [Isosphaeraceae bacterium]
MRHADRGRIAALGTWTAALALIFPLTLAGVDSATAKEKVKESATVLKVEETVADLADIRSSGEIPVEGVGLVIDLEDTGSDPEPSHYRAKLLEEMRKRGVRDAEPILVSKRTSLVRVKAKIPVGIDPKDVFDVQIELTDASATTSLTGGWLLPVRLSVIGIAGGETLEGRVMAMAEGPVLTGTLEGPDDLRAGRVLGGGRAKKELPYTLVLKESRKSAKAARLVQTVINTRFFQHRGGIDQKGLAEAKTDEVLTLKVPRVYHQNQIRYFQVVNLLPIVENPALRAQRLERWGRELLDPKTAGATALRLEGIGPNAVEILKTGLASPDLQVQYFSAEALAYLGDGSGADVLARAAVDQPTFRAHALAAMAAVDHPAALQKLRGLLSQPEIEVRYGAFNALRVLEPDDPFLGQVRILQAEPPPPSLDDAMALALPRRREAKRVEDPFSLYVVDCEGPPLIHVSRSRRCEIVVFGKGQKLLTPVVLGGAGTLLLNAADGDTKVQISRIGTGQPDEPDRRITCPLELGEVVIELARLDATYPDILALLQSAATQRNLPGPLMVDAVPVSVPEYDKAQLAGAGDSKKDDALSRAGFLEKSGRSNVIDRLRNRLRGRR